MNILFLASTVPRYPDDGQAPFVLEQALAWAATYSEDRVFVLAPHDDRAKTSEIIEGVRVIRFRYWWPAAHQKLAYPAILPNIKHRSLLLLQLPTLLICGFLAARKISIHQNIDFIFAHWVMPQGIVAYLLHQCLGIPYGLKNYSSDLRVFQRIPLVGPIFARNIIRASVRLICENSLLRKEAIAMFPASEQAVQAQRVVALTMGVFHELNEQGPAQMPQGGYDFAFIGRLSRKKGVDLLINALRVLDREGFEFRARIAGTGEEEDALVDSCELQAVEFIGHVSGKRKEEFFRQSKFFIFPSITVNSDIEGLPVAILEALYLGKIIIASRATNIHLLPEWDELCDRVYLLEDPRNVDEFAGLLRTLLSLDAQVVDKIVEKTQSVTAGFSWNRRIEQYRRLLIGNFEQE